VTDRLQHPLRVVPGALALLALAACAAPPQPMAVAPGPVQQAAYAPPPATALPPAPAQPPQSGLPSLTDLARDPARFEGLDGNDVLATLGDPNFRRHEAPAEVWQYYGPSCILDLFLYDDGPGVGGRVAHAELRDRPDAPADAACLSHLIDKRRAQRAG